MDTLDVNVASSNVRFTLKVPTAAGGLSRPAAPDADSLAIRKERVRPAVGVAEYRMRFNMKSEVTIPLAEAMKTTAMASHAGASSTYRMKKRYSFFPKGPEKDRRVRVDVTAVRQLTTGAKAPTPTFAQVARSFERYEVEIECVDEGKTTTTAEAEGIAKEMISHFSVMLKVLDDTDEIMSVSERKAVLAEYGELAMQQQQQQRFVGPKPVTLERKHLFGAQCLPSDDPAYTPPTSLPCASRGYTVTDKADGERRLLMIARDRRVYTINDRLVVRNTGLSGKRLSRCLLDGEYLPDGRYLAFDAYFHSGRDLRDLPLMLMLPGGAEDDDKPKSRRTRKKKTTDEEGGSAHETRLDAAMSIVRDVDVDEPGQVAVKEFRRAGDDRELAEACRHLLIRRDTGRSKYHVDGLILTPAATPVPKAGGTWQAVLKWKPPDQNTIDFQVRLRPAGEDLATGGGGGSAGIYVVADLLVGQDPWLATPLTALEYLSGRATERLKRIRPNSYEAVQFNPPASLPPPPEQQGLDNKNPPPPPLHVAYLALPPSGKHPRCANGDDIVDGSVVEFAYDASTTAAKTQSRPARWRPLRVRWDKVEAQLRTGGVTANNANNAYSVWASIVRPISEQTLCDPSKIAEERTVYLSAAEASASDDAGGGENDDAYYVAQIRGSEDDLTGSMRRFHNHWVKRTSLLMRFPASRGLGRSVFDFGCGRGGDLGKWLEMGSTRVVGVDKYANGINDPNLKTKQGGAYVRLMQAKGEAPGGGHINPAAKALRAVFIPMDASLPLQSEATIDALPEADGDVARVAFGLLPLDSVKPQKLREYYNFGRNPFDLATCMFAIHYFFESRSTLDTFARNVAQQLRPGGHFCGCCLDGDRVDELLRAEAPEIGGSVGGSDFGWRITRQYPMTTTKEGGKDDDRFGRRIDVLMDSIGREMPEFLVDLGDLDAALSRAGLRPPTPEEASELALFPGSPRPGTGLFDGLFEAMRRAYPVASAPNTPPAVAEGLKMSDREKQYSFLNRWFVYVK